MVDIASTAASNARSLAFDGLLKPLTLRTNCNAAARISSSVTGGSKLKRILMFLHMCFAPLVSAHYERTTPCPIVACPSRRRSGVLHGRCSRSRCAASEMRPHPERGFLELVPRRGSQQQRGEERKNEKLSG